MGICCSSRSCIGICLFYHNVVADGFYSLNILLMIRRKKTENLIYLICFLKFF